MLLTTKQERLEAALAQLPTQLDCRAALILDGDGFEVACHGTGVDHTSLAPLALELRTCGVHRPSWLTWVSPGTTWLHRERLPTLYEELYLVTLGGTPPSDIQRSALASLLDSDAPVYEATYVRTE